MKAPQFDTITEEDELQREEFVEQAIREKNAIELQNTPAKLVKNHPVWTLNSGFQFRSLEKALPKLEKAMKVALNGQYEPFFVLYEGKCFFVPYSSSQTPEHSLNAFSAAAYMNANEVMARRQLVQFDDEIALSKWETHEKYFAEGNFTLGKLIIPSSCERLFGEYHLAIHEHGRDLLRPIPCPYGDPVRMMVEVKSVDKDNFYIKLTSDDGEHHMVCHTADEYDVFYAAQGTGQRLTILCQEFFDVIGILPQKMEKRFIRLI